MGESRLFLMLGHAWRVRRLKTAVFAVLESLAVGPLKGFWERQAPWYAGKLAERRQSVVTIDGCRLDASAQVFTTFIRGNLWLQRYEDPERIAVARYLDPALPVVELGASMGMISCLINRRLSDRAAHVAVEANAAVLPTLERNRTLNGCGFSIVHAAVAYDMAAAGFAIGSGSHLVGHVATAGEVGTAVETVTLQQLLDRFGFERATLVCDIEGMEVDLWQHEAQIVADRVAWIMIEMHPPISGPETVRRVLDELRQRGFELVWERGWTRVLRNTRWASHLSQPREDRRES